MKVKIIRDVNNEQLEELFIYNDVVEGKAYEVVDSRCNGNVIIQGEFALYEIYNGEYEVVE